MLFPDLIGRGVLESCIYSLYQSEGVSPERDIWSLHVFAWWWLWGMGCRLAVGVVVGVGVNSGGGNLHAIVTSCK